MEVGWRISTLSTVVSGLVIGVDSVMLRLFTIGSGLGSGGGRYFTLSGGTKAAFL